MARKNSIITGTRADYGLLYWLMKEIEADAGFVSTVADIFIIINWIFFCIFHSNPLPKLKIKKELPIEQELFKKKRDITRIDNISHILKHQRIIKNYSV